MKLDKDIEIGTEVIVFGEIGVVTEKYGDTIRVETEKEKFGFCCCPTCECNSPWYVGDK